MIEHKQQERPLRKRPSTATKSKKQRNDISNPLHKSLNLLSISTNHDDGYKNSIINMMEGSDIVIAIQHCHDCESHNSLSLRHDPRKYLNLANNYLRTISSFLHSYSLCIRLGVIRIPIRSEDSVGAFEILVMYRNNEGEVKSLCLHSKLKSKQWPSKLLVEENLKTFLADERVPLYSSEDKAYMNTCSNSATFKSYPLGYGPWEETNLFEEKWEYLLPSINTITGSGKSPSARLRIALNLNFNIEWVYDSRETELPNRTLPFFVLQKLIPVPHDSILEEFKYLQYYGKLQQKTPDAMTINTVCYYTISPEIAQKGGKEFLKLMRKNGICNLSCSIKALPPYENEKTQLTIVAMASSVKGNGMLIKFKISLSNINENSFKFNCNNYGKKLIELGAPCGTIFQSFEILLHPEDELKPPSKFILLDKKNKRQIINEITSVQLESRDGLYQFSIPSFDNTVDLPLTLEDGVWNLTIDVIGYEPLVIDFIVMLGWTSLDSPRKVFLETLVLPLCKTPLNNQNGNEIWQGYLSVYPPVEDLYIDISIETDPNQEMKKTDYIGSFSLESPINISMIENIPKQCNLNCSLFVILQKTPKELDKDDILFGAYSDHPYAIYHGKNKMQAHHFKNFKISKTSNVVTPNFIDSGADVVKHRFIHQDVLLVNNPVSLVFKPKGKEAGIFELKGRSTDKDGYFRITLPSGNIQIKYKGVNKEELKKEFRKFERASATSPSNLLKETMPVNLLNECTELIWIDENHPVDKPIIILGDISGSMVTGNKIEYLKATFRRSLKDALKYKLKVAFIAWNSWNYYCYPGGVLNQSEARGDRKPSIKYITDKDENLVLSWIENIRCGGGNNMRFALEDSLQVYSDATDVFVICDGDVRPFSISGGSKISQSSLLKRPENRNEEAIVNTVNWPHFRSIYPRVKFHFVAIGKDAQHEEMCVMAAIGDGSFTTALF